MAYRKKTMYRRRPAPKKKGGVVKRAIRRVKKQVFAKRVKTVVNRMSETKIANYNVNNEFVAAWGGNSYTSTSIKIITPSQAASGALYFIPQGTGQGAREGNKITTVSAWMTGCIHINTEFNLTNNYNMCPLYVAMYFFRFRSPNNDNISDAYSAAQTRFFQAGSSVSAMNGLLFDLTKTVNSNVFQLLAKKVYKVGTQYVSSSTAVGTSNIAEQQFSDGTVGISKMFRINLTKMFPKVFTFDDGDNTPKNRNVYCMWVPFRVDGDYIKNSAGNQNACVPAYVDYSIDFRYKDM